MLWYSGMQCDLCVMIQNFLIQQKSTDGSRSSQSAHHDIRHGLFSLLVFRCAGAQGKSELRHRFGTNSYFGDPLETELPPGSSFLGCFLTADQRCCKGGFCLFHDHDSVTNVSLS